MSRRLKICFGALMVPGLRDNHLFTEFCPKMSASSVEILESIIKKK